MNPAVQVLEWVIDTLGLASGLLLGSRRRSGWIVSIAAELVWLAVAWWTHQWAFVASSFVYGAVAVRGWRQWKRTEPAPVVPERRLTDEEYTELAERWARQFGRQP